MKLNLPTKNKKLITLSLLGLVAQRVKAGDAFNKCLADNYQDVIGSYKLLLNSPALTDSIPKGATWNLCCDKLKCSSCPGNYTNATFYCTNFNQTIFCEHGICGGNIADTLITSNTTLGNCLYNNNDLTKTANYLAAVPVSNFTGISKGYASLICPSNSTCVNQACAWDSNGWTCYPYYTQNCYLQWPASFPGSVSSATSTTAPSFTPDVAIPPHNPHHLVEKIGIPVGTVVGVATIGGVTYYFYHKRKKNEKASIQDTNENITGVRVGNPEQPQSGLGMLVNSNLGVVDHQNDEKEQVIEELPVEDANLKVDNVQAHQEVFPK